MHFILVKKIKSSRVILTRKEFQESRMEGSPAYEEVKNNSRVSEATTTINPAYNVLLQN